jgi:hypothetical protein
MLYKNLEKSKIIDTFKMIVFVEKKNGNILIFIYLQDELFGFVILS